MLLQLSARQPPQYRRPRHRYQGPYRLDVPVALILLTPLTQSGPRPPGVIMRLLRLFLLFEIRTVFFDIVVLVAWLSNGRASDLRSRGRG